MSQTITNVMECAKDNGSDFLIHLNHDLPVFNKNNECNLIQHLCRKGTKPLFTENIKMLNYAIKT